MFRDQDEELQRLENALLAEEETPEEAEDELFPFEDPEDTRPADGPIPYRNHANHYRVTNTDRTDVDLEEYSRQVYEGKPKGCGLWLAVLFLLIAAAAIYGILRYGGFL